MPATMAAIGRQPTFGLASVDPAGRLAAVELARVALAAVARLNKAAGRAAVAAVEIQSGPTTTGAASSVGAFVESLAALAAWDWHGAVLVVEHCDAVLPGAAHAPAKGFLRFEDEVAAVQQANAAAGREVFGLAINWARSVLESRDVATPVAQCAAAGPLLRGLVFSGCSGAPPEPGYGGPWADAHLPHDAAAAGSLLTRGAVADTLAAAKAGGARLKFLGAKITLAPAEKGVEARVAVNEELLGIITAEASSAN